MKKKHIIFISIIVLIIISGIIAYVFKNNKNLSFNKTTKIALYTIPEKEKVFVNGVISPQKTENIYLDDTKGSVDKVSVSNGQVVKNGDALFTYKNDQITDEIDKANQQVTSSDDQKKKLLEKQAEAKKQTAQPGLITTPAAATEAQSGSYQDQIDLIQTQINTSKDQLKTLKTKEFTYIRATIDGKVILNDTKDKINPYIVIESSTLYVKGSITEKDQPKLKVNQNSDILVFALNKTLTGKVTTVENRPSTAQVASQAAASTSQTATSGGSNISNYDVDISLNSQENIINGFHVQATVQVEQKDITIPKSSILQEAGKNYVFKVANKKLTKQEITYKASTSSKVILLTGLKENDSISISTKDMKEGISVE